MPEKVRLIFANILLKHAIIFIELCIDILYYSIVNKHLRIAYSGGKGLNMNKITRKEMQNFVNTCTNVKKGYCCLQDDGFSKWDDRVKTIGYNSGIYGWNFTLYYVPSTDTAYIDGYRNF